MDRTLKCDHSLESCGAVLYSGAFGFKFYPVGNFGRHTVRSERVNSTVPQFEADKPGD